MSPLPDDDGTLLDFVGLTALDPSALAAFAAYLRLVSQGRARDEAYDLVYSCEAPASEVEA